MTVLSEPSALPAWRPPSSGRSRAWRPTTAEWLLYGALFALALVGLLSPNRNGSISPDRYNLLPAESILEVVFILMTIAAMSRFDVAARSFVVVALGYATVKTALFAFSGEHGWVDYVQAYKAYFYLIGLAFFVRRRFFDPHRLVRVTNVLILAFFVKYLYSVLFHLDPRPGLYFENNFELIMLIGLFYLGYRYAGKSRDVMFVVLAATVVISGSRSGALSLLVLYIGLYLRFRNRSWPLHVLGLGAVGYVVVSVFLGRDSQGVDSIDRYHFLEIFFREVDRWPLWEFLTGSHPITPLSGASCAELSFYSDLFSHSDPGVCYSVILHSYLLRAVFDQGLIGLCLLYALLWMVLSRSGAGRRDILVLLGILTVSGLSVSAFNNVFATITLAVALGLDRGRAVPETKGPAGIRTVRRRPRVSSGPFVSRWRPPAPVPPRTPDGPAGLPDVPDGTPDLPAGAAMRRVAVDSFVGSAWTLVSRVSGLVRIVVVGAVLGPTFFANLYQSANNLPNLVYELLTGALFASLVVPALVRHFDRGDARGGGLLASRFLTLSVTAALGLVALTVAAGPAVLRVLTLGVPAGARGTGGDQAWLLLGLLILQVPLYVVVGMGVAAQNARGRFALAAGAPSVENLGIIAVMAAYAVLFGHGSGGRGPMEVLLLAGGTTAAVLAHAALQWWGARRAGVRLALAWHGWRSAEVAELVRLAVPSLGYAGLSVARYLFLLVVAAAAPGAVVALTMAWAFYNLPLALVARPVALAALPHLSRAVHSGNDEAYRATFSRTLGLALFLSVPTAIAYAVLSGPLANMVTFGQMATPEGRELVRFCLLGISLGVIGLGAVEIGTQAAYARRDAGRPFRAVALRTALAVAGMLTARALLDGPVLLLGLGASMAISDLVAGALLCWTVTRGLPRRAPSLFRTTARTIAAGLAALPVGLVLVLVLGAKETHLESAMTVLLVGSALALVYLAVQWGMRSPETAVLGSLLRRRRPSAVIPE